MALSNEIEEAKTHLEDLEKQEGALEEKKKQGEEGATELAKKDPPDDLIGQIFGV